MEDCWLAPPELGVREIVGAGRRLWVGQGGHSIWAGDRLRRRDIGEAERFGMKSFDDSEVVEGTD